MERLFSQLLSLALLTQLALCTPAPESIVTPKGGTTEGPTTLAGTDQLSNKIVLLEEQLIDLRDLVKDIKNEMRVSHHRLKEQVQGDVRQLLADVRALRDDQQEFTQSITERVNRTAQVLNTDSADTITLAQLSTLQTRLDTLTRQITSPVNLYQGCVQESRTCSITGGDGTSSYRECSTSGMAIEVRHFSMQCMAKYLCKDLFAFGYSNMLSHKYFMI